PNREDERGFEWRYLWRLCHQGDSLHTLRGKSGSVSRVAFVSGDLLAAANSNGTVTIWNVNTRQPHFTLVHGQAVTALAVSTNLDLLATGDADGEVKVWKISTGAEWSFFHHSGSIRDLS